MSEQTIDGIRVVGKQNPYFTDADFDSEESLYNSNVTSKKHQAVCIGYMYNVTKAEAVNMLENILSETDVANACDYFLTRGMKPGEAQAYYQALTDIRTKVAKEYGLSPVEAIGKRAEIWAEEEFNRAVEDMGAKEIETVLE